MFSTTIRKVGPLVALKSQYGPFISGRFVQGQGEALRFEDPATGSVQIRWQIFSFIALYNPDKGTLLVSVNSPSESEINDAITRGHHAFQSGVWSKASTLHRSNTLFKLARLLHERIPDLAVIESIQTGRPIREMKAQLGRLPEWLEYYAGLIRTQHIGFVAPTQGSLLNYVTRVPLGVVAQITPFNHPMLISVKKLAPALAAGNSVIVKPSELAPISVLEFAALATEAGIPADVLSVLPGASEVGKAIISHPLIRKVDITAGTKTGRAIGSVVGQNLAAFTAELGGKAPVIIFDDADLESAINGTAFAAFVASGQTCVSGTRLLVQDGIYDAFLAGLLAKVKSITERIGDPLNPLSTMGPLISPVAFERVARMMSQTRGKVVAGGSRMKGLSPLDGFDLNHGCFYPPTVVVDVDPKDELFQEEVFGPIVTVTRFKDEASGVALANDCKYGLGASIWTADASRAHRVPAMIEAGLCWVNTHHRNDPSSPWGGMKESGIGRENGIEALESYSQSKSTIINTASPEETRIKDDWFAGDVEEKRYG
ncbi:hypothetical protein FRB97_007327 [Tulasnella sp. 331]|nr:hypothetical protein FRB97_007327 [Tulasnella sp. 331]